MNLKSNRPILTLVLLIACTGLALSAAHADDLIIARTGDTVIALGKGPESPIHVGLSFSKNGYFPMLVTLDRSLRMNDVISEIFDDFRKTKGPPHSKQIRCSDSSGMSMDAGRCIFALESADSVAPVAKLDAIRDRAEKTVHGTAVADSIDRHGIGVQIGNGVLSSSEFAGFNFRMGGEAAALLMKTGTSMMDCRFNPVSGKPACWFWMDPHGHIHRGQLSDHLQM